MPGTFQLHVGERSLLTPVEKDKDGNQLPGPFPNLTWGTSDASIGELVVDQGLQYVYARAAGSADVSAQDVTPGGKTISDLVTFNVLALEADSLTIEVGTPEPIPA